MIKKIYNGLILFFFIAILIFYGSGLAIREYNKITNEFFNATIYLNTTVSQENTIRELKAIADEYDLTVAKFIPENNSGIDIFVYSHKNKYIHDFLFSNRFIKDLNYDQTITYSNDLTEINAEMIQTFFNKGIFIRPLDHLKNIGVEGKYALNVDDASNLENLLNEINNRYGNSLTMYYNQRLQNTFTGDVNSLKYNYGMILIVMLFITLLTSFLYDIKGRKKEIAVKRLLGYGTEVVFYDIFIKQAVKPMVFSVLLSQLIVIPFFVLNKNIKSLDILKYFLKGSLKFSIPFAAVFMTAFALFLLINIASKSEKIHIVSYIKGKKPSKNTLSVFVKMGSTLIIIVAFGISAVSWNFISEKKEAVHRWEETKNYATLNIYVPDHIFHNKKRAAEFEQTHKIIWNYLNEKNGLLFYKTTNQINENSFFINNQEVDVPFVYINENYLIENPILDATGNRISSVDNRDNNAITVLVPMRYKFHEEELRQTIHKKHVYDKYISEDIIRERITGEKNTTDLSKENLNNPSIMEKFIYIKDNQSLFTYTAGGDFITDGILAIVTGENMGLNVYTPSFTSMNVKYDDINELNREISVLFNDLGYGEVETDFASVYQQNAEDVQYFKNLMGFSLIVFVLSLIFLVLSLLFYLEIYFQNNKKRIAIKNFLGFNFFSRNKKVFIGLFLQDAMIILISLAISFFISNKVVGIQILKPILASCLLALLFDTLCSALVLKGRESKFMVETLKGE
ncbi:DUF1430 domain-containing protein [Clostridium formicaceticum]|nr:DUF1430 domain-containing protein [Clostridium formicaceticum]AOY74554.1 hypothetical protein BJL90_00440 [Clostridium formicaceticum]